jgi:tRNA U34 5-methylaminomethyl-2-thiouridine-forming methyltransferase MnmC
MKPEITADGSATLRVAGGDTYHSTRGAVGEARHVFIEAGFREVAGLSIFEMGFGTGLNAWLTLCEAEAARRAVEYTAVEQYPVPQDIARQLGYSADERFMALHSAPWSAWRDSAPCTGGEADCVATNVSPHFRLCKLHGDVAEILEKQKLSANFDLIYWDAFAPDTQPELWTPAIFEAVFAATAPGGVLVTYSAKGDVKRALRQAGFTVERLPGALGKRHMVRATKPGLLCKPQAARGGGGGELM